MSEAAQTPLVPWTPEECIAFIRGRRVRTHRVLDSAEAIARASGGWLTATEVRTIWRELRLSVTPITAIADTYDLSVPQVYAIQQGQWVRSREQAA